MAFPVDPSSLATVSFWATIIATILTTAGGFAAVVWGKNRDRQDTDRDEAKANEAVEMELDARERQNLIDNMRAFNQTLQERIRELDAKLVDAGRINQEQWNKVIELERRIGALEVENARLKFLTGTKAGATGGEA
jgi:uncharacterized protein HemX